jgi:homocysteine S-methyltransferase
MYREIMNRSDVVLGEGSMYERLRRSPAVELDPHIAHGSLIYNDDARAVLGAVHREYLDLGQRYSLPLIASSATWRASAPRITRSAFAGRAVNRDNARFMLDLRDSYGPDAQPILIAGNLGPIGDAYIPAEAPDTDAARSLHQPQIGELADSGVDLLTAKTLPAFGEALGIVGLMAETGLPYTLSFVALRDGTMLDGTPIEQAVARIDDAVARPPDSYNLNCVHTSVFAAALNAAGARDTAATARFKGLEANTSAKTPEELEGLEELDTEAPEDFGSGLWAVHQAFGTCYLGGCCGTSTEHIEAFARCRANALEQVRPK